MWLVRVKAEGVQGCRHQCDKVVTSQDAGTAGKRGRSPGADEGEGRRVARLDGASVAKSLAARKWARKAQEECCCHPLPPLPDTQHRTHKRHVILAPFARCPHPCIMLTLAPTPSPRPLAQTGIGKQHTQAAGPSTSHPANTTVSAGFHEKRHPPPPPYTHRPVLYSPVPSPVPPPYSRIRVNSHVAQHPAHPQCA